MGTPPRTTLSRQASAGTLGAPHGSSELDPGVTLHADPSASPGGPGPPHPAPAPASQELARWQVGRRGGGTGGQRANGQPGVGLPRRAVATGSAGGDVPRVLGGRKRGWKRGGGRVRPQAWVWAAGGREARQGRRPEPAAHSPEPACPPAHSPAPALLQAPRPRRPGGGGKSRCHPHAGPRASRGGQGREWAPKEAPLRLPLLHAWRFSSSLTPCCRPLPVVCLWAEGAQGRARPSSFGAEELPGPALNPRDLTGTVGGP